MGSLLFLSSCAAVVDCEHGDDTAAADQTESGTWSLGDVQTCASPLSEATWTDASGHVDVYAEPVEQYESSSPGGVGLLEVEGKQILVWDRPYTTALARDLHSGSEIDLAPLGTSGLTVADIDNNGVLDLIFPANFAIVWDAFTASEQTQIIEAETDRRPQEIALADLDGDSDPDLLSVPAGRPDDEYQPRPSVRWNLGGRNFGSSTPVDGDASRFAHAFDVTTLDLNGDAAPDAYICNDHGEEVAPNAVLVNDGSGNLEVGPDIGLDLAVSCMGTAWGDANNDGELDAYVGASGYHHLLLQSKGEFYDAAAAWGLESYAPPRMPWGSQFADMDNDGNEDLIIGSACFLQPGMERETAWWFRNTGEGFVDEAPTMGIAADSASAGVILRDLNDDGVVDAILGDSLRSPWIYLSSGCTAGAWVEILAPIGSTVVVEAEGIKRAGLVTNDSGWNSGAVPRLHIGLGAAEQIDSITIVAPWGQTSVLEGPIAPRRRISFQP